LPNRVQSIKILGILREPVQTFIVHAELEVAEKLQAGVQKISLKNVAILDRGDTVVIE
jgi:hypothetical protein